MFVREEECRCQHGVYVPCWGLLSSLDGKIIKTHRKKNTSFVAYTLGLFITFKNCLLKQRVNTIFIMSIIIIYLTSTNKSISKSTAKVKRKATNQSK